MYKLFNNEVDLQNTFYTIGIICMTLYTLLLLAIVILLFYIKKKITDVYEIVEEKIDIIKDVAKHPNRIAETVGGVVADIALSQAEKFMHAKRKKQ